METNKQKATLSTVAVFPKGYFLENLAVRSDNSLLVTSIKTHELWYVPPAKLGRQVEPVLMFTFDTSPTSIVEPEPDVFYLCTTDGYATHASSLHRLDLRGWKPGQEIQPEQVLTFPSSVRALNGSCLIGPRTILVADSFASLIWRVDLSQDGRSASASIWLKHYSMLYHPGEMKPEQPGVNGLRFSTKTSYLYYTSTVLRLFMRVRVDRQTLAPLGIPEYLGGDKMMDDFCVDEDGGVAYVTTHRENTIDRMSLEPDRNEEAESVAGKPFDEELVGPSSGAWGRAPGEAGRVAFFTTDGGTTALPTDGVLRPAKILRVEF
jgi:DNA-binding beta-propeller fold protein YncE